MMSNTEKQNILKPKMPEIIVYGFGDVALNMTYTMFSSFVMYFYTNSMLLNASLVGLVILLSRIFDGISDVLAGSYIDNHKTKGGHCVPWLKRLAIPYAVSFVLVFTMPNSSTAVALAYLFVTYNLFNTIMYTFTGTAQMALPVFVTNDQQTRSVMVIVKMLFTCICQILVANITLPAVNAFGGDQAAWIKVVAIFAVIGAVIMLLESFVVKERITDEMVAKQEGDKIGILEGLKSCITNKYWLISFGLLVTGTVQLLFSTSISTYYFDAVHGNASLVGPFILAFNAPGIIVAFIMPSVIAKIGKRNMMLIATGFQIVGELLFCILPTTLPVIFVTAVIRGIGFGVVYPLGNALLMDVVEYGEWKTGIRNQGLMVSVNSVAVKIVNGLGQSLIGFFITAIAYDATLTQQTASTISSMDNMFKWAPIIFYIIQVLLLLGYHLDKEYPQIIAELEERRSSKGGK